MLLNDLFSQEVYFWIKLFKSSVLRFFNFLSKTTASDLVFFSTEQTNCQGMNGFVDLSKPELCLKTVIYP
jgi:hypothetical protein